MNWRDRQNKMLEELNTKVFSNDPCRKIHEEYSSVDVENSNYIQELKNRERYGPHDFDGSLIEKKKYDFLITQSKILDKIPGYVCRFNDNSYWAWNLNKVAEPIWYEKMLPETSYFERDGLVSKQIEKKKKKNGRKII